MKISGILFLVLGFVSTVFSLDIDVTFIDRLPNYAYDAKKNKPADGDVVTFVGHIKLYDSQQQVCEYIWYLDGILMGQGSTTIYSKQDNKVSINWTWDSKRHEIMLVLDPQNKIQEESEENNIIFDFTDALIMGIAVEEGLVEAFSQFQKPLGIGSLSFEDWVQRQAKIWNIILMRPAGELVSQELIPIKDRVRALISYHKDRTLDSGNCPIEWKEVDMIWGKMKSDIEWYKNEKWAWFYEAALPHELSHARYLPDDYIYDVGANTVEIIDDSGIPVIETDYLPKHGWDMVYYNKNIGVMDGQYCTRYSLFSGYLLNRAAGKRAMGCNGNGCCWHETDWYSTDLPLKSYIKILKMDGTPWVNAKIDVYNRVGTYGECHIDNVIDYTLFTDTQGRALFPYDAIGGLNSAFGECIIKITSPDGQKREYRVIERTDFHIAFWQGKIDNFDYTIKTNFDPVPIVTDVINLWEHDRGETFDIEVYGKNFLPGASISFDNYEVILNSFEIANKNKITFNVTVLGDLTEGITFKLHNPDGKYFRIIDPYQSEIHMNFSSGRPYARFVYYNIEDRIPGAIYFNGLWSDDWGKLYVNWGEFPVEGTGPIVSYFWDFGDGTKSDKPYLIHTYGSNGTFKATLTVTDKDGKQDTYSQNVVITNAKRSHSRPF